MCGVLFYFLSKVPQFFDADASLKDTLMMMMKKKVALQKIFFFKPSTLLTNDSTEIERSST